MAQAIKDMDNLGALTQAPYGGLDVPMVDVVRDVDDDYQTIFDISAENGIDVFKKNPEEALPQIEKNGLVSSYLVKEVPKLGLAGEYNTHVGVKLNSKNIRAIEFVAAKEEAYEALECDSIVDEDQTKMLSDARQDYAKALVQDRERKFIEQVKNSGILVNDPTGWQTMYDELNLNYTAPTDIANITGDDLENLCVALPLYFEKMLQIRKSYPVLYVSNNVWGMIVKSPAFNQIIHDDTRNKGLLEANMIGVVHDTIIVRYKKLDMPGYENDTINMIAMQPGAAYLEETPEIRPVKYRPMSEALTFTHKVMDTGFISGTYQQLVFILDNFIDTNGTVSMTKHFIVFTTDAATFVQDPSVVHFGKILGDAPTVHASVNRTLQAVVNSTYDNSVAGGGEVVPLSTPLVGENTEALVKDLETANAEIETLKAELDEKIKSGESTTAELDVLKADLDEKSKLAEKAQAEIQDLKAKLKSKK